MTGILFLIETISSNIFGCNYLKKKVFLSFFFFEFSKFKFHFESFQKKNDAHTSYIFELTDSEKRG